MNGNDVVGVLNVPVNVKREVVDDILCAAFEGGINYWVTGSNVSVLNNEWHDATYASEVVSRGGAVWIPFEEDDVDCTDHILNLDKFINGLGMACSHYGMSLDALYNYHDADIADCVIQFAMFGELIYG